MLLREKKNAQHHFQMQMEMMLSKTVDFMFGLGEN